MANYRTFHGLSSPAFGKKLEPGQLLVYPQLQELHEELDTLLWEGGVGLVTGEMGMGKTTALRSYLARLDRMSCDVAYGGSSRHPKAVLEEWLEDLGLAPSRYRSDLLRQLSGRVGRVYLEQRKKTLILLDDAHLMEDGLLEDLRLLTNFEMDAQDPLILVLVGHPALRLRLKRPVHLALWDRIRMHYRLEGLSREESFDYIDHHLKAAGAQPTLFNDGAKTALFEHSQGIPRRLNRLALEVLKKSARRKTTPIDEELVATVVSVLQAD